MRKLSENRFVSIEKKQLSVSFSERLKQMMEAHGETQKSFARKVGVAQSAVFNWLHGSLPRGAELFRVARHFKKPMEWFLEAIPEGEATSDEKASLLARPDLLPGEKLVSAARQYGLSPRDLERMLDHTLNHEQIWERTKEGGFRMYYRPRQPVNLDSPNKPTAKPGPDNLIEGLTDAYVWRKYTAVKSPLKELLAEAIRLTAAKGMKARLAVDLGVPQSRVSEWFNGKGKPSGDAALMLQEWVLLERKRQQK